MKRKADPDREMKSVFDIILSFLQSFSITQSFILFPFPRTIMCRQLMEVQYTVVKSMGSWARQAISSSSKTILLKTLKIEKKKTLKNLETFFFLSVTEVTDLLLCGNLVSFGLWTAWNSDSRVFFLALWAIPTDPFSLESGCSYSNIMTAVQRWASSPRMQGEVRRVS